MALKWIIGDFRTGDISESNTLPVVYNSSDKIELDVNAGESATLTVSKNDLPSDWRTYLRPVDRFVALVDTELAYASAVLWAGFINKVSANVNDTIKIQAAGLREYMAARTVSKTFNSTNTDPETSVTFQSNTYRGIMANMILDCFSSSGIPSNSPRPPAVLTSVTGSASGSTIVHKVLLSDFENYGNMIDEWRDEISDAGQEYRFAPSWSSSSKTRIRWIGEVAAPTAPHFNEASTLNIVLADNEWKPLSYGQSASSDNMVSRIIGQSKEGEKGVGADYQTKTTTSATSILLDESWNPGVELTSAQMTTQLNERLSYNSQTFKEADFERTYETLAELRTIISQLGSMATFSGSGASQYFGLTMRIVGLSYNISKKTVQIQLAPKAARYPKLPKDNRGLKPKSETKFSKPKSPNYGDYTNPIVPQPKPGSNGSDIPGGEYGSGINPPSNVPVDPFTPPQNDRDVYVSDKDYMDAIDSRWFKSDLRVATDNNDSENWANYWHPYPLTTRSRFNNNTGEFIGINSSGQKVYSSQDYLVGAPYQQDIVHDIDIWSIDIEGMFDWPDSGESGYHTTSIKDSFDDSLYADEYKYKVGTIPASLFAEVLMPIETFRETIVDNSANYRFRSGVGGTFDYSFFCSEDLQTLYVQVIGTASCAYALTYPGTRTKYSHCTTLSRLFKGVRNSEGVVESWENLGEGLVKNPGTNNAEVFFSNSIYEINGEFVAFGGFLFPIAEERKDITNLFSGTPVTGGNVAYQTRVYASNFYSQDLYKNLIPEQPFSSTGVELDFGVINRKYVTNSTDTEFLKNAQAFLACDVDYKNKIVLVGITQGQNSTTSLFEASFNNLTNCKKVIDTAREEDVRQKGIWSGSTPAINYNRVTEDPKTNGVSYFTHSDQPCVKYGEYYFWMLPQGYNSGRNGGGTGGAGIALNTEFRMASQIVTKAVKYIISKQGFRDTIWAGAAYPEKTWRNTYVYESDDSTIIRTALPFMRHNKQMGNSLFAYLSNENRTGILLENEPFLGGMKYFVKGDYMYIVFDSRYWSIAAAYGANAVPYDNRLSYWISKNKIKGELL